MGRLYPAAMPPYCQSGEFNVPILETLDQEHENLALHVDLCQQRYEAVEKRLTSLESKIDLIHTKIDGYKADISKILITTAGTITVSIIGLIGVILSKL